MRLRFGQPQLRARTSLCGNSSVVEHNLAKVGVASSNLVSRSNDKVSIFPSNQYLRGDPKGSRQRGWRLQISFPAPMLKFSVSDSQYLLGDPKGSRQRGWRLQISFPAPMLKVSISE
jgi:hypothetical protein